jgi:D-arabinose 1-dehydrogenase-like Zn-dependent alcohol dehydrogenase
MTGSINQTHPFFGSECNGGHADFTVIRAENAQRVETDLSDAELATSPGALHTTEPLVGKTGLQPGETVIVTWVVKFDANPMARSKSLSG